MRAGSSCYGPLYLKVVIQVNLSIAPRLKQVQTEAFTNHSAMLMPGDLRAFWARRLDPAQNPTRPSRRIPLASLQSEKRP